MRKDRKGRSMQMQWYDWIWWPLVWMGDVVEGSLGRFEHRRDTGQEGHK